jgi:TctA family transporter
MYGKEDHADALIEQMVRSKDSIIRYGAMFTIGCAYAGTSNNSAVVANWLPLLVFGMPITSIEIVFLQHFNQYGFSIQSLLKIELVLDVLISR